jgi:FtsH-binding integral membrane protein
MRLDATLSGALGLFVAVLADALAALTGLSSVAEFSGGAVLVLCGLAAFGLAASPDLRRAGIAIIVGNIVLTVAVLVVLAVGALPLTQTGVAALLATGGYFALMGYLQYLGVRHLRA